MKKKYVHTHTHTVTHTTDLYILLSNLSTRQTFSQ